MRVWFLSVGFAVVAACGGTSLAPSSDASTHCTPNQSVACVGPGGCAGGQTCNAEGTAYLTCDCTAAMDAAPPSDASSAGDSATTADASTSIDASSDSSFDGSDGDSPTCVSSNAPSPSGTSHVSDPTATETTNANGYVLHKALAGYPNYGTGDDSADILYTGSVGAWTFAIPGGGAIVSATVVVSVAADDNSAGAAAGYSFNLWSSSCVFTDSGDFSHGAPFNAEFTNWAQRSYPAEVTPGGTFVVTMANTSSVASTNWIGVEWLELQVTTQ
jgi:hypothetical protein